VSFVRTKFSSVFVFEFAPRTFFRPGSTTENTSLSSTLLPPPFSRNMTDPRAGAPSRAQ